MIASENELREYVRQVVLECLAEMYGQFPLLESVDIDVRNKVVSFNPNHQDNVDTNDYLHPHIIENSINGEIVLSIFERKDNEERNDGNPLVYALKGIYNWKFSNPKSDIFALLRRFVAVTKQLHRQFDTLIMTSSTNELNNIMFNYLRRLINFKYSYNTLFEKLTVNEVENFYYDEELLRRKCANEDEFNRLSNMVTDAFATMRLDNNGVFSYKYIPLACREAITQSVHISFMGGGLRTYASAINNKDVLVLDDTVASGKTISDSSQALRELFDPKSITFLTLFSPKESSGFINKKIDL